MGTVPGVVTPGYSHSIPSGLDAGGSLNGTQEYRRDYWRKGGHQGSPLQNSLTLTLSQRERGKFLLSQQSQGLRPGLGSCRAVGAYNCTVYQLSLVGFALLSPLYILYTFIPFTSPRPACILPGKS